jgi:hypothetical protein
MNYDIMVQSKSGVSLMNTSLEQAITIAFKLSPSEQAQLLEQLASHLANQVLVKGSEVSDESAHWGQKVWAVLEGLDTSDWDAIDDPVEWVKEQRRQSQREINMDNEP